MSLFSETDPEEARNMSDKCRLKIKDYEKFFKNGIDDQIKFVSNKLNELKIRNSLLNVAITVSTGIFYSKTTLKGYGIVTSSPGEMTVTDDDITKNNPVTAVFLNFNPHCSFWFAMC